MNEVERGLTAAAFLAAVVVGGWLLARVLRRRAGGEAGIRGPVILYFWTESCAQCRGAQAPILARLAAERPWLRVEAIDALASPRLARRFAVMTVPATIGIDVTGRVRLVNHGLVQLGTLERQVAQLAPF